jgi:DNA-binding beta-propeller fold protein YncE
VDGSFLYGKTEQFDIAQLDLDLDGNLLVPLRLTQVVAVWTPALAESATMGQLGTTPGSLLWPLQGVVDLDGNVYVVDRYLPWITIFDPEGTLIGTFGTGSLQAPCGIAIGLDGAVYVADCQVGDGSGRVVRFDVILPAGAEVFAAT